MITNQIDIKIFKDINDELKSSWLNMEKNGNLFIFQTYFFINNFIKGKNGKFIYVVLSSNNKIFCILPFHVEEKFGLKILQWIGTKELDYCGPIMCDFKNFVTNEKHFKQLWNRIIKNFENIDIIFLNKQLKTLNGCENPFAIYLNNYPFSKIYSINLNSNYENYLKEIENKKFLNEFQRTKKKLLSENKVEFFNLDLNNNVLAIDEIISEKARYLDKKKIKHHLDDKMIQLFKNLKKENNNFIKISVLKINNEIIAANIGFIFQKRFYYYMPVTFSNKFNKFSPGKVLISYLIELSVNNRLAVFDFGLGDENYKKYWSNNTNIILRHLDYKTFKGLAFYCLAKVYSFIKKFL